MAERAFLHKIGCRFLDRLGELALDLGAFLARRAGLAHRAENERRLCVLMASDWLMAETINLGKHLNRLKVPLETK